MGLVLGFVYCIALHYMTWHASLRSALHVDELGNIGMIWEMLKYIVVHTFELVGKL